jgi:hypothetical protein
VIAGAMFAAGLGLGLAAGLAVALIVARAGYLDFRAQLTAAGVFPEAKASAAPAQPPQPRPARAA